MQGKTYLAGLALVALGLPLPAAADDAPGAYRDQPAASSRSAGEHVDDAAITAKVKSAFVKDDKVSALDVKVNTYRGVVQLSGFVDDSAQIDRAGRIAGSVPGVKSVENDLQVRH